MYRVIPTITLCSLLWAFDCMHFTQTRIATIDVYGVFFILLMFFFMYEYVRQDYFTAPLKDKLKPLALSGVAFGLVRRVGQSSSHIFISMRFSDFAAMVVHTAVPVTFSTVWIMASRA